MDDQYNFAIPTKLVDLCAVLYIQHNLKQRESNLLCFHKPGASVWQSSFWDVHRHNETLLTQCHHGWNEVGTPCHPATKQVCHLVIWASHKSSHLWSLFHWTVIVFDKYNRTRHDGFSLSLPVMTAVNWRVRSWRCVGMRVKAQQLHASSQTGADMVIVWIIDSTCRGAHTQILFHYPLSLPLLSTCQVETAAAPHTHREPGALMHSWHSSDAKSAVDIFTVGAIILSCLCRWGENNGGDFVDGEAEESKGRRRVRLNLDVLGCQRNTLHLEQQHTAVLCSLLLHP